MKTACPRICPSLCLVIGAVVPSYVAAPVQGAESDLDRFMKIRAPGRPTLAPDLSLYVRDWPDGINQLYRRGPESSAEGPYERLTDFEDGLSSYALSPNGAEIILAAASGGSEQDDLFRLETATGEQTPLFVDPAVVFGFQTWLADSTGFIYSANDASPSDFYLYHYDLASGLSRPVLQEEGYWRMVDVTRDGRRALVARYHSVAHADAFELNLATRRLNSVNVADGAYNWPQAYLPGEEEVVVTCDHEEGIPRLFIHDIESKLSSRTLSDLDASPVEAFVVNRQRTLGVVTYNEDGYRTPRLVSLPDFDTLDMPGLDKGYVGDVSIERRIVVMTMSNARTPGLTFAYRAGAEKGPMPLTAAETQGIDLDGFTLPKLVRYHTFDDREIPAFIYTPPGYEAGTAIPWCVMFHGGPESQSRPRFSGLIQYMLSRGFGVMQPNVRGSTGYGRAFSQADNGAKRWDSVRDGVAAARWLVHHGYAEPGKIAAYGGSYGGFMAVATVIEDPEVFGASVNVVGIVNFQTFLEQTKSYRRALREVEYGFLDDPEMLKSISPIHRVDDIQVPMLIAHGLNDPRVPVGEAMQLAVGLQKRGADPELMFFPDEGHGFAKLDNRLLFYRRMVRFLERTIGG